MKTMRETAKAVASANPIIGERISHFRPCEGVGLDALASRYIKGTDRKTGIAAQDPYARASDC